MIRRSWRRIAPPRTLSTLEAHSVPKDVSGVACHDVFLEGGAGREVCGALKQ